MGYDYHIVRDLLDYARPQELTHTEIDLKEVITSAIQRLRASDVIEIELDIDPDLPSILGDRVQLQEVFINLISNAIDAMDGDQDDRLAIKAQWTREGLQVDIVDTGKGIDEENLSHIFEPFFTTKPVGEGTGLGLSLVQRIIEAHDGSIEIVPGTDTGTRVIVKLPLKPAL